MNCSTDLVGITLAGYVHEFRLEMVSWIFYFLTKSVKCVSSVSLWLQSSLCCGVNQMFFIQNPTVKKNSYPHLSDMSSVRNGAG